MSLVSSSMSALSSGVNSLSYIPQNKMDIEIEATKLKRLIDNVQKTKNDQFQTIQRLLIPFNEKAIQQIKNALQKPVDKRLQDALEMQGSSISKAEGMRNVICALFHEVIMIPAISTIDRKDARLFAMDARSTNRSAKHQLSNVNAKTFLNVNLDLLCMESLAFFCRFHEMLFNNSTLSKEHINFLIAHKNEIKEDLKGFIADVIIRYEIAQLQAEKIPPNHTDAMHKFNQGMSLRLNLKLLFEEVCPIGSALINRYNKESNLISESYVQTKSLYECVKITLENSDVYRPLFDLWVETIDYQKTLFDTALTQLNAEKDKAKPKIKFIQTYFKDPLEIVEEQFSNYPRYVEDLLLKLKSPYILEGDLERAFMSNLEEEVEEKKTEEKHAVLAKTVPPNRGNRVKKTRSQKSKPRTKSKSEETVSEAVFHLSVSPKPAVETKKLPYVYAARVRDWFTDSPKQLSASTYNQLSLNAKQRQWAYHGFSRDVDQFLLTYGIQFTRQHEGTGEQEIYYCVPGEILFLANSKNVRGLFTFTINKNNELYHRYFKLINPNEIMVNFLQKTFYDIDFPELKANFEEIHDVPVELPHLTSNITINSLTEAVTIQDTKHNMQITLFKLT